MVSSINYNFSPYLDCFEDGNYKLGSKLGRLENVDEAETCQQKCQENPNCQFWYHNFNSKVCYLLREGIPETGSQLCNPGNCNRGPRICPQGLNKIYSKLSQL